MTITTASAYARLKYFKWENRFLDEKPYQLFSHFSGVPADQITNFSFEQGSQEEIRDIRTARVDFSLDDNGFQLLHKPSPSVDFGSLEDMERAFRADAEHIIRSHVEGADAIFIFDYRVRIPL